MFSPRLNAFVCASLLLTGAVSAQSSTPPAMQSGSQSATIVEDFEMFSIGYGSALTIGTAVLDENTIALGQGPGLVLDGCVYSSGSNIQWNDAGYYGMLSKNILSSDTTLTLTYDQPVSSVALELSAFQGYSDFTVITVYNAGGSVIHTSSPISVPGATGVPWSYQAGSIGKVTVQSQVFSWSTLIDNHVFGTGGPALAKNGTCPGPMSLGVTGATPNSPVAILYGQSGSYTRQSGLCAGTTIGISNPTLAIVLNTNGQGSVGLNFNAPPGLCGRTVQGVDLAACAVTNKITL